MSIEKEWEGRMPVYRPTCDICGAQLSEQYTFSDAVEAKKIAGWKSKKIDGMWHDICEECQKNDRTYRNDGTYR